MGTYVYMEDEGKYVGLMGSYVDDEECTYICWVDGYLCLCGKMLIKMLD